MATPLPIDEWLDTAGHREFFRFDSHAHFVAFVMHIAGLFESREYTINLPTLVSEFAASNLAPAATIAEAKSILSEAHPLIPKIIILPSNLFAHRSATLTYAKAFEKADITANQLGHLCELALRLVNRLLLARSLDEKFLRTLSRSHAEAMLNALAKVPAI